ncbi:MAG: hypothetical protein KME20_17880 [Kaiparowitsia implicata GSE-PSE-MK54-09C]|jgi:hypothetical protein|nr:hypothetical protein [Kaiparowitsia implicata GSE-PSE-MK54-09C]
MNPYTRKLTVGLATVGLASVIASLALTVMPFTTSTAWAQTVLLEENGALEEGDMVLPSDNSLYDEFQIEGTEGQRLMVRMKSEDFVTYLAILDPENPANPVLGENGNVSDSNDSQLEVTLPRDGTFVVIANGLDNTSRGAYTLEVMVLD